jgi:hypothetical protein
MGLTLTNGNSSNRRLRLTNSLGTNGRVRIWLSQPSSNDPDAQAFITAAGITDPTQQSAINTLVISMKANGTWAKCNAIYPMVGGTATTCKFNLKNPLDTDDGFRLNFVGGWSFSANGALPNGTNAYADTFLTPNTTLSLNSTHLSFYSRTDSRISSATGNNFDVSGQDGTLYLSAWYWGGGGGIITNINNAGFLGFTTNSNSQGFYISSRILSNSFSIYKNNVNVTNRASSTTSLSILKILLGAGGTTAAFSPRENAFTSIGSGLNSTEAASLYTDVQAFQTTLGRQV